MEDIKRIVGNKTSGDKEKFDKLAALNLGPKEVLKIMREYWERRENGTSNKQQNK